MFALRQFREEDREPLLEIDNRDAPAHWHSSAAEWIEMDKMRSPEVVFRRLVVGHPETDAAIAYLEATDRGTALRRRLANVVSIEIRVAHDWRRQGIGAMLYAEAVTFARERGAKRMTAWFQELAPGIAFAKNLGFELLDREQPSSLDLTTFDFALFAEAERKASDHGVRIFRWADVPDTEENRHRLYDLINPINRDMPTHDPQPYPDPPLEEWEKRFLRSDYVPETQILAEKDGQWIGISMLWIAPDKPYVAHTGATGVLREYRGLGIATALKVRAFREAAARGCAVIPTSNHEENGPMLAINRKLGFVPDHAWVTYHKTL